ncbi:hypothetical protein VXQ18_15745 [Brucella abortus]|nr:hypothetical protein [Brucella abortus]
MPLVIAVGAAAASRRAVGTSVFGGMIAASAVGIFPHSDALPWCWNACANGATPAYCASRFMRKKNKRRRTGTQSGPTVPPPSLKIGVCHENTHHRSVFSGHCAVRCICPRCCRRI